LHSFLEELPTAAQTSSVFFPLPVFGIDFRVKILFSLLTGPNFFSSFLSAKPSSCLLVPLLQAEDTSTGDRFWCDEACPPISASRRPKKGGSYVARSRASLFPSLWPTWRKCQGSMFRKGPLPPYSLDTDHPLQTFSPKLRFPGTKFHSVIPAVGDVFFPGETHGTSPQCHLFTPLFGSSSILSKAQLTTGKICPLLPPLWTSYF